MMFYTLALLAEPPLLHAQGVRVLPHVPDRLDELA